jgi:L-erythrulose 1-phosphate isomerase
MSDQTARPRYVGTNLKLHQTPDETVAFVEGVNERTAKSASAHHIQRFIIPPYTSLPAAVRQAGGSGIWIGAQNVHWAPDGAFTGEISVRMLQAVGVDLVLIGHAERRGLFHETDDEINAKVLASAGAGFRVLLCIGETAAEKRDGVGHESVVRQLKIGMSDLPIDQLSQIMIGYEPVWSIGPGGTPAQPEDVAEIAAEIRAALHISFGAPGVNVPILYGGSVSPANCAEFTSLPVIDGVFVGRAAWTVDGFSDILNAVI